MDKEQEKESFLRIEYEFLAKAYEVQFTHFMGVFYFWIAVIGAPTTAGVIAKVVNVGFLCIGSGLLGIFLAAKMFDIRHSQFRYIAKMNELRGRFWSKFDIMKNDKIEMLGKDTDLEKIARTDFGIIMAWVMSLINGLLIAGGVFLLRPLNLAAFNFALAGAILILVICIDVYLYYRLVVWKLLSKPKTQAAQQSVHPTGGIRRAKKGVH